MLESAQFKKKYNRLNDIEKTFVDCLAVTVEQVTKTDILNILRSLHIRDSKNKAISFNYVAIVLEKLLDMELIICFGKYSIDNDFLEIAFCEARKNNKYTQIVKVVREKLPLISNLWGYNHNFERCYRDLLINFFDNQDEFDPICKITQEYYFKEWTDKSMLRRLIHAGYKINDLAFLSPKVRSPLLVELITDSFFLFTDITPFIHFMKGAYRNVKSEDKDLLVHHYTMALILQGKSMEAEVANEYNAGQSVYVARLAFLSMMKGHYDDAEVMFDNAVNMNRKEMGVRKQYFTKLYGLFYFILLYRQKKEGCLDKLSEYMNFLEKSRKFYYNEYEILDVIYFAKKNDMHKAKQKYKNYEDQVMMLNPLTFLFFSFVTYWLFPKKLTKHSFLIEEYFEKAKDSKLKYFEMEYAILNTIVTKLKGEKDLDIITKIELQYGMKSVLPLIRLSPSWETALDSLLGYVTKNDGNAGKQVRLIWQLEMRKGNQVYLIEPKEQKRNKSGSWTKGRVIALKRLMEGKIDYSTPQDKAVCATISKESYGYYGSVSYELNKTKALPLLCGHPLIFLKDLPGVQIELIKADIELLVEEKRNGYTIKFSIDKTESGVVIFRETPTRYKLYEITEKHRDIWKKLGSSKLTVPKDALPKLKKVITGLSSVVTVHSSVEGESKASTSVDVDNTIYLHLLPVGEGFRAEMLVKPLGKDGPAFEPGEGGKNIIAKIEEQRVSTVRNLNLEKKKKQAEIEKLPTLDLIDPNVCLWDIPNPVKCLELLAEIKNSKNQIVTEWPEGEKIKYSGSASVKQLSISIKQENEWFSISGKVDISDKLSIEMTDLINRASKANGRFIPLDDGSFVSLENSFFKKINALSAYADISKKSLKIHPLTSLSIEDLTERAGKKRSDKQWKGYRKKVEDAFKKKHKVSSLFQGELRDYQLEGYRWLKRIADIGAGACLADDMGLGKTIQALAVLLDRCKKGPALIVAPTSLCYNWANEANKFTPAIKVNIFGSGDREKMVKSLGKMDMMICSYGLVLNETELLSNLKWSTVIFDEAQAIKNASTLRAISSALQLARLSFIISASMAI